MELLCPYSRPQDSKGHVASLIVPLPPPPSPPAFAFIYHVQPTVDYLDSHMRWWLDLERDLLCCSINDRRFVFSGAFERF